MENTAWTKTNCNWWVWTYTDGKGTIPGTHLLHQTHPQQYNSHWTNNASAITKEEQNLVLPNKLKSCLSVHPTGSLCRKTTTFLRVAFLSACNTLSPCPLFHLLLFLSLPLLLLLSTLPTSSGYPWHWLPSSCPIHAWWAKDGGQTVTAKPVKRIWPVGGGWWELAALPSCHPSQAVPVPWLVRRQAW